MRDSYLKAYLHIFCKEGDGNRTKRSRGWGWRVLYVQTSTVYSDKASDGPVCVIPNLQPEEGEGERREKERERNINVWLPLACPLLGTWPTTQACTLEVEPATLWFTGPQLRYTSQGRSLYLLKLVARILIQTRCLSTSYVLVKISYYRNSVKRTLGWVTISHH